MRNSFRFFTVCAVILLASCFLENPVKETGSPDEFDYNVWLLSKIYLYPEELPEAEKASGGDVSVLYDTLSDPYTRYVTPAKSGEAEQQMTTSIIPGGIGIELIYSSGAAHPLYIYRVYPGAPAGRAGVPRYGHLLSINGTDLSGDSAYAKYASVLQTSSSITLRIEKSGDSADYALVKETIYAPTVFIDTFYTVPFISIREFTLTTADKAEGTLGELRSALEATSGAPVRVIDIRNNPGGYVNECIAAADLFVKSGTIITRFLKYFDADGNSVINRRDFKASPGDIAEAGKFVLLANRNSASCAEIFTAALKENAGIPFAGDTTFGKGIGQGTWKTSTGGLAIITQMQFRSPLGNNYHKTGIAPDIACGTESAVICAAREALRLTGKTLSKNGTAQNPALTADSTIPERKTGGGALIPSAQE